MALSETRPPFPRKRLLRESLSQIANGLVWLAFAIPLFKITDAIIDRAPLFADTGTWFVLLAVSGGLVLLAAPVLIADRIQRGRLVGNQ